MPTWQAILAGEVSQRHGVEVSLLDRQAVLYIYLGIFLGSYDEQRSGIVSTDENRFTCIQKKKLKVIYPAI